LKLLLFKCNCDHYFRNVSCPYDGWTHSDIRRVEQAFREGTIRSLEELENLEVDPQLMSRIMIIDSFEFDSTLDGVSVDSVVIDGNVLKKGSIS
jgi:hypothetical protein